MEYTHESFDDRRACGDKPNVVAASAEKPDGTFVFKDNTTYDQTCLVGRYSSQITQNGQFVRDQAQEYPGSRTDEVRSLLDSCRANGDTDDEDEDEDDSDD